MARKQFVSSKKNAPSRAVSSKEAALHGRAPASNDGSDRDGSQEDDIMDSPVSSVASSPISSDAEDDAENGTNADDVEEDGEVDEDLTPQAVAVQVMPASVGRGKQLRFPTMISRGKESRVLYNGSDREGSDSESYASVASEDEEGEDDEHREADAMGVTEPEAHISPERSSSPLKAEEEILYPIKAFRARKRHRPDSGYFRHMSTHVRDCLLSVRDVASAADVFRDEVHHEFRRKLSNGTVERVQWKEASPPPVSSSDVEKKKDKRETSTTTSDRSKKEKHNKKERDKREEPRSSSEAKRSSEPSSNTNGETSVRESSTSKSKETRSGGLDDNNGRSARRDREAEKTMIDKNSKDTTHKSKETKESSGKSAQVSEAPKSELNGSSGVVSNPPTVLCANCQKAVNDKSTLVKERSRSNPPVELRAVPPGYFTIPSGPTMDVKKLREKATQLNEEARALKHEGNRKGTAEAGTAGQVAQGKYYLRSSAKFFQHALVLADVKAAYKEVGDNQHARQYGDFCVKTLAQTSSLIESTIRTFQSAGCVKMVALGYKLASIVHLTIYRLQHLKLFSLYSDLFTPGRSPDTRQNGTTPPISGSSSDSQDSAVRNHLLKEMEHTLRGFEMWRRYEACKVEVLPRISNPAVIDLTVLFEDLQSELEL